MTYQEGYPAPSEAAVDAAMAAIPCSCDPADTSGGTLHQMHCDTNLPPDVVRKMLTAAAQALYFLPRHDSPCSGPCSVCPPGAGHNDRDSQEGQS